MAISITFAGPIALALACASPAWSQEEAAPAAQAPERDYEFAEGELCEVFAHWRSERNGDAIAKDVAAFADEVLKGLMDSDPLVAGIALEGQGPLLINLYRRPKDLVMARTGLGIETKGTAPFHLPGERAVHVAIRPTMTDIAFEKLGTPGWVLRDVGEAAGLAWLDSIALGLRGDEGGWVREGLLLHLVHRKLVARAWATADAAADPTLGSELQSLAASTAFAQELLRAPLSDPAARAARRVLVARLGTDPKLELTSIPEDWPGLDLSEGGAADQCLAEAAAQAPSWILETASFLPYGPDPGRFMQVAHGTDSSRCWYPEPAGKGDYTVSGTLLPYAPSPRNINGGRGSAQGNVLLGERGGDYFSVAFNTFTGVTVFEYLALTDEYRVLLKQSGGVNLVTGVPFEFRIRVGEELAFIEIDGERVGTFTVKDRDMSGRYGLGAQMARGICVWSDIQLTRP